MHKSLRWQLLTAIVLVLAQVGFGIAVNLYVTVPIHHPGARPSDYLTGSFHSVSWAMVHGPAMLAVHALFGLVLVVVVVLAAVHAMRSGRRAVGGWSLLGGLCVIGVGFNGASFLDFGHDASSLIMALLALTALGCYATALVLLAGAKPT